MHFKERLKSSLWRICGFIQRFFDIFYNIFVDKYSNGVYHESIKKAFT
jgi:hypothetical protein